MKLETVQIDKLKLDPRNARTHSERNLESIKESLRQFGQRKPIVIDSNGLVVAGNGTVVAARDLGWVQLSATRTPADWSKKQVTAYAIADNRTAELASWDTDILIPILVELDEEGMLDWTGFTTDELENWDSGSLNEVGEDQLEEDRKNSDDQGELLEIADVIVDEPKHQVHNHEIWTLVMPEDEITHVLIICKVMKEWILWKDYLQGDAIFVPYPDPYLTHTDIAKEKPLVMVQPDHYLASHLLDKHSAIYGEETIVRLP